MLTLLYCTQQNYEGEPSAAKFVVVTEKYICMAESLML